MRIGDVAAEAGVATSAIRYYERIGLLPEAERVNGRRHYQPQIVDLLRVIGCCRALGFSLAQIRELRTPAGGAALPQRWQELAEARLAELDEVIAQARAVRRVLEASKDCSCLTLESCTLVREANSEEV